MRNKANCPRMSGNGHGPGRAGTEPPAPGDQLRETKPISLRRQEGAKAGKVTSAAGPKRAKQSQFHRSGLEYKCFTDKGLGRIWCARDIGKTKPIAGGAEWAGSGGRGREAPASTLALRPYPARCTNKANFRTAQKGQEPAILPVPMVGAILRNKANFSSDDHESRCGQYRSRTKPISACQVDPRDLESAGGCRPHPPPINGRDCTAQGRSSLIK